MDSNFVMNAKTMMVWLLMVMVASSVPGWCAAQDAKLKQAMSYKPFQDGVQYEMDEEADYTGLKLTNAESLGQAGFLVRDENDAILRRFVDSDGDKKLDTWAYYLRGVEVYRDVDTNQDTKPDTFYWLGPEGSRIGLDVDQNRVVDGWKKISPQEVTIEVLESLKARNVERMQALFLTTKELSALELSEDMSQRVSQRLAESTDKLETRIQELSLSADAQWMHFGAPYPGAVVNQKSEIVDVFDNVSALYEADGENRQLAVGSMVQVGDTWKLIDFPVVPGQENARVVGGVFFQTAATAPIAMTESGTSAGVSMETLNAYQAAEDEFRQAYGNVDEKELAALHARRAQALMAVAIDSEAERENWARQYADIVSAAYQAGEYPDGLKELESQMKVMEDKEFEPTLIAYAKYRSLNAWYSRAAEESDDLEEIQEQWQKRLNDFIDQYPRNELAAEALFELAKIDDYIGDIESAEEVYQQIVKRFPDSPFAARAKGAVVRLTSEGKRIQLAGSTVNGQAFELARLKGRMVLVHYWATWCEPCKAEFDEMKDLYARYKKDGFEIVSISLDESRDDLMDYLSKNNDLPWIHLYAEGGLEQSPLAAQLGVIALPTMLLVEQDGTVMERGATLQQVERELRKLK